MAEITSKPTPCGPGTYLCGGACAVCGAQATRMWLGESPPVSACDQHAEAVAAGSIDLPFARYTPALRALLGAEEAGEDYWRDSEGMPTSDPPDGAFDDDPSS